MPFEYQIDPEKNLIRNRWIGKITIDQFVNLTRQVNEDPDFRPGMNTLSDCREADWTEELDAAHEFVWHTEALEKSRGACKWAVLVSNANDSDLIEAFNLVSKQRGIEIETRAFESETEAIEWLET